MGEKTMPDDSTPLPARRLTFSPTDHPTDRLRARYGTGQGRAQYFVKHYPQTIAGGEACMLT